MNRRIKDFGYTDFIKETVEVDADTIRDMEFPGIRIEAFENIEDLTESTIQNYRVIAYAEEDTKGIHVRLVRMNNDGELTDEGTKEIVLDEEEFVDEIYEAVLQGNTAVDSDYFRDLAFGLMRDYAMSCIEHDHWFFEIEYDCTGFICTGDQIIGTVGAIEFGTEQILLKHCVGSMNLDNIQDCSIKVKVQDRMFQLFDFKQSTMVGEGENLITYTIKDASCRKIKEFPVTNEQLKEFKSYTPEDEEAYVQFRTNFISKNTQKEQDFFGDEIDDLL